MTSYMYALGAVVIGACLSMQPPINAVMSRTLGSPLLAASISILISLICVVVLWFVWGRAGSDLSEVKSLPWWVLIGGVIGVVFVAGSLVVAPVTGLAVFFVCVVAGQLIGATLGDKFGLFGMPVRPVEMKQLAGLALVLVGAALVQSARS